jgi:hypothetical protein
MIKRTDANHKQIIDQIRQIPFASVFSTHELGKGFPDIVVGFRGINYLFEIKDGKKSASQKKLTEAEVKFHNNWMGQVHIIEKIEDILQILKLNV